LFNVSDTRNTNYKLAHDYMLVESIARRKYVYFILGLKKI
jgi:hypothetical protein